MELIALTREVSASINDCALSFHARQPIDVVRIGRSVFVGLSRVRLLVSIRLGSRQAACPRSVQPGKKERDIHGEQGEAETDERLVISIVAGKRGDEGSSHPE